MKNSSPETHGMRTSLMAGIKMFLNSIIRRNDGQTLVEYVLVISLVSILLIVSLGNLGASDVFNFAPLVCAL